MRYFGYLVCDRTRISTWQVLDGYFVKYFASTVALLMFGLPIWYKDPSRRGSQGDLTQDYIRAMRLLQNTSRYMVVVCRHMWCQLLLLLCVVQDHHMVSNHVTNIM